MCALNRHTGKVVWTYDFISDFEGKIRVNGYAPSPIAWHDTVIVFPNAPNAAVAALHQATVEVVWKKQSFLVSYATPISTVRPLCSAQTRGRHQLWSGSESFYATVARFEFSCSTQRLALQSLDQANLLFFRSTRKDRARSRPDQRSARRHGKRQGLI
jgi:hypothetical protein